MNRYTLTISSILFFASLGYSQIDSTSSVKAIEVESKESIISNYAEDIIDLPNMEIVTYLKSHFTVTTFDHKKDSINKASLDEPEILREEKKWSHSAYNDWIKLFYETLNYPKTALKYGIQGKVTVVFLFNPDGVVIESDIIKSVPYLDEAIIKSLNTIPKWTSEELDSTSIYQAYRV